MSSPALDRVPDPPEPAVLQRLELRRETWPRDRAIYRIHSLDRDPASFNPGQGAGRFHPIATHAGAIPTLYGGSTLIGALCETLFRLEPADYAGALAVPKKRVLRFGYATLAARRELTLFPLKGDNLRALGIMRANLLEPGPVHYTRTAAWGAALHIACPDLDGLIWRSRQHDESECIVLFGDRTAEAELGVSERATFEPPAGWQMLLAAAQQAGFTITEG